MCGIFGLYSDKLNVAQAVYFGLFSLQHRGQESAGISVSNGVKVSTFKKQGLVSQVFTNEDLDHLQGDMAIGHVRYSTTGSSNIINAQPFVFNFQDKQMALAHNGNIVNVEELRSYCESKNVVFNGSSDTEVMAAMLEISQEKTIEKAIEDVAIRLRGAYSFLVITPDKMIGMRDPYGIRPMVVGELEGGGYAISSEDCALSVVGGKQAREILPGEMCIISRQGMQIKTCIEPGPKLGICSFEFIYLARPDSCIAGKSLYDTRVKMGRNLFREHPVEADAVISVPDSGTPAAIGYSKESRIPFAEGLIKNRYIGRTFIQPDQLLREVGVRLKLNPIISAVKGKKIVIVDDSIVRGTTSKKIVKLLRQAGAKEIHFRVSSPMVINPCFYGIDTATKKELVAANYSVEEIRKMLGVDSLGFLSLEGLLNAMHLPKRNICLACFDGDYPVPVPEELQRSKHLFEK